MKLLWEIEILKFFSFSMFFVCSKKFLFIKAPYFLPLEVSFTNFLRLFIATATYNIRAVVLSKTKRPHSALEILRKKPINASSFLQSFLHFNQRIDSINDLLNKLDLKAKMIQFSKTPKLILNQAGNKDFKRIEYGRKLDSTMHKKACEARF